QRRLVHVQGDRDGVGAGVADGVVLVRRDQAAGAAGAGLHAAGGAEAEAVAVAFQQLVLCDLQFAVPHALHAPAAGVVVHGRALARAPGHGHHAVAVGRAAVELAAGVVVGDGLVHAGRQAHHRIADQPAHRAAQGGGDGAAVAGGERGVDAGGQALAAGGGDVGQGASGAVAGVGHGAGGYGAAANG